MEPKSIEIKGESFDLILSSEQIKGRIDHIAIELEKIFQNSSEVIVVGILNGAFMYMADLLRRLSLPIYTTFIQLRSYEGMKRRDEVSVIGALEVNLTNKDVLIVEDIVDSGNTLAQFINEAYAQEPARLVVTSLLIKPTAVVRQLPPMVTGFEISESFVIGYGMDWSGHGRELPGIYQKRAVTS